MATKKDPGTRVMRERRTVSLDPELAAWADRHSGRGELYASFSHIVGAALERLRDEHELVDAGLQEMRGGATLQEVAAKHPGFDVALDRRVSSTR